MKNKEKSQLDKYFCNPENVSSVSGDNPNDFYKSSELEQARQHIIMNKIECNDGFRVSVQASFSHYCSPRKTLRSKHTNYYKEYELGFPSESDDLLEKYKEVEDDEQTNTIFPYVPKEVVDKLIEKHGGINNKQNND